MNGAKSDLQSVNLPVVAVSNADLAIPNEQAPFLSMIASSFSRHDVFTQYINVLKGSHIQKGASLDAMVVLTTLVSASLGSPLYTAIVEDRENDSDEIINKCLKLVPAARFVEVTSVQTVRQYSAASDKYPKSFVVRERCVSAKDVATVIELIKPYNSFSCLVVGGTQYVSSVRSSSLVKFPLSISTDDYVSSFTSSEETKSHIQKFQENMTRRLNGILSANKVNISYYGSIVRECIGFFRDNPALGYYLKNLISCVAQMNNKFVDTGLLALQTLEDEDSKSCQLNSVLGDHIIEASIKDYYYSYLMIKRSKVGQLSLSQKQQDLYNSIKEINLGLMGIDWKGEEILDAQIEKNLRHNGTTQEKIQETYEKNTNTRISVSNLWNELKYLHDKEVVLKEREAKNSRTILYSVTDLNLLTRMTFPHPSRIAGFVSDVQTELINPFTDEFENIGCDQIVE